MNNLEQNSLEALKKAQDQLDRYADAIRYAHKTLMQLKKYSCASMVLDLAMGRKVIEKNKP